MKKGKNDFIENDKQKKSAEECDMNRKMEETEAFDDTQCDKFAVSEDLKQKVTELSDRNLRLMAEFDNYKKRTLKERSELIKTAGENILINTLPLVDDFERALKAMETAQDLDAVKEGVLLIYEKFIGFLSQNGVKEIPTEKELFDVDLHEAITTFPAPSDDMKGKIMDCVSKGYTLNDKVIRYPKVVVCE